MCLRQEGKGRDTLASPFLPPANLPPVTSVGQTQEKRAESGGWEAQFAAFCDMELSRGRQGMDLKASNTRSGKNYFSCGSNNQMYLFKI